MAEPENNAPKERPAQKYQHTYGHLGFSSYQETPKLVKNFRVAISKLQNNGQGDEESQAKEKKMKMIIVVIFALVGAYFLMPSGGDESAPAAATPPAAAGKP